MDDATVVLWNAARATSRGRGDTSNSRRSAAVIVIGENGALLVQVTPKRHDTGGRRKRIKTLRALLEVDRGHIMLDGEDEYGVFVQPRFIDRLERCRCVAGRFEQLVF